MSTLQGANFIILLCLVSCSSVTLASLISITAPLGMIKDKTDQNLCCFPKTFSLSLSLVKTIYNSTITGIEREVLDNVERKRKTEGSYSLLGKTTKTSTIMIAMNSSTSVNYVIENNSCSCRVIEHAWNELCVAQSGQIQKSKIFNLNAFKIFENSEQFLQERWFIRNDNMPTETCFPLSIYYKATGMSMFGNYYNMSTVVDQNEFLIPSFCPSTLENCQHE